VVIGKGAEYTALVNRIAQEHNVKVDWRNRSDIPRDSFAFARVRAREIVVPHIQGDEASCQQILAVCLHELGHCLAEPCRGGDHAPVNDGRWHNCLRCEQLAWSCALELAPFSRAMFAELQRGLRIYRRKVPGPKSAVAALDRQCGSLAFAESRQSHVRRSIDVMQWEHEQRLLSPQARFDRRIAAQRKQVEEMRAARARRG